MNYFIEKITGINPQSKDPLMAPAHGKPVLTAMDIMSALVDEDASFADLVVSAAQDAPIPSDSKLDLIDRAVESIIRSRGRQRRYYRAKELPLNKMRQVAEFALFVVHQQKRVANIKIAWDNYSGHTSNYQFSKIEPILDDMVEWIDDYVSVVCRNAFEKVGFGE